MNYSLIEELTGSQQVVAAMLRIAAEDQSARVGAWSVRDIAAHLCSSERECFEPRIRSMAAGDNPTFEFFTNDETDFSGVHLESALDEWAEARARLLEFVRGLTAEQRSRTGQHQRFGRISVDRYLEIALEHDRDHLLGLEKLAGRL
ncbi:MAG: DinB family protein [Candidatus Dormibacterales bacterium]